MTALVTPDAVEAAARAVYEHTLDSRGKNLGQYRFEYQCECGEVFITDGHNPEQLSVYALHADHVATAALAAAAPLIAQQTLLDAAAEVHQHPAAAWLTARAATLAPKEN